MNSRIEKVTVYLGRGKDPMINSEGEHPLLETDLSSNNDKRCPEGTPSEQALQRIIVRLEIRNERKPEPSHRYRKRSKTNRRTKVVEPKSSSSTSDRTWDERNEDTVEALKQQVLELKKKLKRNKNSRRSQHSSRPKTRSRLERSLSSDSSSASVGETEEEESSDGRNKGGRSSGKGSRGNWSESPSMARQPYRERREQETVWKALHQISHSPFSKEIERAHLPGKFFPWNYVMYDGRTDPIGHISHFRQSMALHLGNDALMCRMFPSSLGPMSLRWFNRLQYSSIHSWDELAEAFISRFITNSRKPKEFDVLMSMRMKDSESLKSYSSRYWEVYNEVDGGTEDMAIKTFKQGLDPESELRHSLSKRLAKSMRDLMSRIQQYVRVEEDRARTRVAEGSVVSKKPRTDFPNNEQQIFFSDEDLRDVQTLHDDPLVVKLRIGDSDVKRVLIDHGSCFEIMYPDLFHGLGLKHFDLQPYNAPLVGFSGESVRPMGQITMTIHTGPISLDTEFLLGGVKDACIEKSNETYEPGEELETVTFSSDPEKYFKIGQGLNSDDRTELVNFLTSNIDVFAWDPYEVLGVDPDYIQHRLNVDPHSKPIALSPEDREKTAFITPLGIYCYKVMPFGLKNVGATYQRMVTKMFKDQIGKTMEIYIDDMVVKSKLSQNHLEDLTETFRILRLHKLKLNASKCVFGVGSGKFLGITAALNRFISRSADRCQPFFQLLKNGTTFKWDDSCVSAFEDLKRYLSSPLLLSKPVPGEPLFLYLAVSERAVSAILIRIKDTVQCPVYYTSKTMTEAETRYLPLEKYPVQAMFHKADFIGRIWKWGAKIGTLDVKYLPRTAIKGQILADFVAEFTPTAEQKDLNETTFQENTPEDSGWWKIYVDGASNAKGSGTGVVIITPDETIIEQSIRLDFKTSNNEAEYEAVLAGLNSAKTLGAQQLIVHCDSLLVASQINGEYMARDERMAAYLLKVQQTMTSFQMVRVEQIGRNLNSHADALATLASVLSADFKRFIPIETLATPSIAMPVCHIHTITVSPCWMDLYVHYLKEGVLLEQKREAKIIRKKAVRFWLSKDSKLYKRSSSGPYLLCVHPDIVQDLLYEIHEGICGSHTGGRSLAHRALTQGYWFGIPKTIIFDNGTQFTSKPFMKYCSELGIRNVYSSPTYPQSNGQAEASNKTVLDGIKKRLEDAKGRWVEELPNVLWTFRTTPRRSMGETPFSLAYGSEAVIPLEISLPTLRTSEWEPTRNDLAQSQALDLLEERREQAMIRLASYQQQLKKGYNKNVRPRSFQQGDLVLRKVLGNTKNPTNGKLGPNWEGLY
uniref:Uncharacterized protein n=1 Tax=Fagus sylvatica TaxID=28930 RepID=A0A2N9HX21_FAGSY